MTQIKKDIVTWLKQWFYTETETDTLLNNKQDTLVSGTNIKTINNQDLLGSGNITVGGGGGLDFDDIYPVGSIYMSVNSANPSTLFGGTWTQLQDTFLYATSTTADTGTTAPTGQGEATHTLTTNEIPSHSHQITAIHPLNNSATASSSAHTTNWSNKYNTVSGTANTGGGQAHNNMPPYMKVYMWKRTN